MIEKLIKKIAQHLDRSKIPYMIIGGQAVLLYGEPRLTRDIDITLGIDTDKFLVIEKVCRELGLKILPKKAEEFARETKVLPAEETKLKIRVDFIFSFTPYEKQAIKRAKNVLVNGYSVKFASCEDLIIHKMFAGRAIDEEDVKNILIKNKNSINLRYIKRRLSEFSKVSAQEEILAKFNRLWKLICLIILPVVLALLTASVTENSWAEDINCKKEAFLPSIGKVSPKSFVTGTNKK